MADGSAAEALAEKYLIKQGLTLVVRNYRCRMGEIDLIMRDQDTLVFVEVRSRTSTRFGGALASIDVRKQHKLIVTAQLYLVQLHPTPPCRFDVVLIEGTTQHPQWMRNAFSA